MFCKQFCSFAAVKHTNCRSTVVCVRTYLCSLRCLINVDFTARHGRHSVFRYGPDRLLDLIGIRRPEVTPRGTLATRHRDGSDSPTGHYIYVVSLSSSLPGLRVCGEVKSSLLLLQYWYSQLNSSKLNTVEKPKWIFLELPTSIKIENRVLQFDTELKSPSIKHLYNLKTLTI